MRKTSLKQKVLLILLGIILTLIILEIILRLAGAVFYVLQEKSNQQSLKQNGEYRILCLGESTTALGGEDAYPRQLEKLLNSRQNKIRFSVINKGIPAITTDHIIEHLSQYINEYKPQMVMTMMGINDHDDLVEHRYYGWESLRVYKLAHMIYLHLSHRLAPTGKLQGDTSPERKEVPEQQVLMLFYGIEMKSKGRLDVARDTFEKLDSMDLDYVFKDRVKEELIGCLLAMKQYHDLVPLLKEKLDKDVEDFNANNIITDLCKTNQGMGEIIPFLKQMIKDKPKADYYYNMLGGCYENLKQPQLAQPYFEQVNQLRKQTINTRTQKNYLSLMKILARHKIKLVVMQYATRDIVPLKEMLKASNQYDQCLWVDNQQNFFQALSQGKYEDYFYDRFAGNFGHCTSKGNYLLADNAAKIILQYLSNT